jgi:hypothetical protein
MPQKIQLERSSLQEGIVDSGGPKIIQKMIKKNGVEEGQTKI